MARIHETEVEPRDSFFEKAGSDGLEQRGRRYQLPMRHEFNNKNIQFKGTIAANANEFLRSRSQMSRNSSTHSNTPVGRRHHSTTTIPSLNNPTGYPSNKSLLSAYNEKTVSDTVLPVRTTKQSSTPQRVQLSSRHGSRNSSVHSFKKNYTFGSESLSNLRDRQESIIGIPEDDDSEYRLDLEIRKRFNKAASVSGPSGVRRQQELKKSSLNHSFNATIDSSNYSDEDEDDGINGMEVEGPLSYDSAILGSVENLTRDNLMIESTSPRSKPVEIEQQVKNQAHHIHDHPMRTLQRQMNIRDQALFKDKDEHEINELTQKWNSFISLDDRRMFEMITNDLRKIARYNQKPVVKSLHHCREHGYLKLNKIDSTKVEAKKFDLAPGRTQIRAFWNELNETATDQDQK